MNLAETHNKEGYFSPTEFEAMKRIESEEKKHGDWRHSDRLYISALPIMATPMKILKMLGNTVVLR